MLVRGTRLAKNEKTLRPVRPIIGIAVSYRRKIESLVEQMAAQTQRAILATYRAHPPEFAQDRGLISPIEARARLAFDPSNRFAQDAPPALTEAMLTRIRQLAEGGDPSLPGARPPVEELLSRGLIRQLPAGIAVAEGYEPGAVVYGLTDMGEAIARSLVTPAARLRAVVRNLRARWERRFEAAAPRLASYFATAVQNRSRATLKKVLKDGGFTVKFEMTPVMRDVLDATIGENVGLIRTIPQKYLADVEGLVLRSVQRGRDLSPLAAELQKRYTLTKKRAALIARDQNNKATSAMTHARQADLGIREAIWMHSHAGKKPRPCHVEMDGKRYEITKGMWDRDEREWVFPGEKINCRCTSMPIIPGLGK